MGVGCRYVAACNGDVSAASIYTAADGSTRPIICCRHRSASDGDITAIKSIAPADVDKALEILRANGEDAYVLGEVVEGEKGVELW